MKSKLPPALPKNARTMNGMTKGVIWCVALLALPFVALFSVGLYCYKAQKEDFQTNKDRIVQDMRNAMKAGEPEKAIATGSPYQSVGDFEFNQILAGARKAAGQKSVQNSEKVELMREFIPKPAKFENPKPSNWNYSHQDYQMGTGRIQHAQTQSRNYFSFKFPYAGLQQATLTLRTHPKYGKDLILGVSRGQFLANSFQASHALVRFDDGEPQSFRIIGAADQSSTSIFFRDYHGFVEKLLHSKRVRISAPVYREGNPVFDFDISSFDTAAYLEEKLVAKVEN